MTTTKAAMKLTIDQAIQKGVEAHKGGKLEDAGEYDLDIHGLPVPLAEKQARNKLKIAA